LVESWLNFRHGSAARCEAVALPRLLVFSKSLGLCPRGAAPIIRIALTEGLSRVLTSGG
jgi:hypothetical protein